MRFDALCFHFSGGSAQRHLLDVLSLRHWWQGLMGSGQILGLHHASDYSGTFGGVHVA